MATHTPAHIAVIMDGNGRWAEARQLPRVQGHIAGVAAVKRMVEACLKNNISTLSLFTFSSENWNRPAAEVQAIMQLFSDALDQEINALHAAQIALRFTGNLAQLAPSIQTRIEQAVALTHQNQKLTLNIMINYGGQWDILQATQKLMQKAVTERLSVSDLSSDQFEHCLATAPLPAPDLLIRTSGEYRISNFALWQLAYTELYFTQTLWPDFTEVDLQAALQDFRQRQRRFGQTAAQCTP